MKNGGSRINWAFGLFAALAIGLIGLWAVSTCYVFYVIWHPHPNGDRAVGCTRGRLLIQFREGFSLATPGLHGEWRGAPWTKSEVLGKFNLDIFDGPLWNLSRVIDGRISIPLPFLAAIAALAAYTIHRRCRFTLAALLTMFAVAATILALYAIPHQSERPSFYSKWSGG
jgi:hypothetical protein